MNVKGDLRFGDFRLDRRNQELRHESRLIFLRPKTFAVLQFLAENQGRLVTKAELLKEVWGQLAVSDSLLRGYVWEVRQALGDDPAHPKFLETLPRRGFRFLAKVCADSEGAVAPLSGLATSVAPGLVSREKELSTFERLLDGVQRKTPQVVFIAGEAGIGKTALLSAFFDEARAACAARTVCGQCIEQFGTREAYLPIFDALGRLCDGEHARESLGVLTQCAPSWMVQMPRHLAEQQLQNLRNRAQGTTQSRMLGEFCESLEALALERPLIFALEDLQWADASTLDLLSMIARRGRATYLMVVGTYRPGDVIISDHPLRAVVRELKAHQQCTELCPDYLSEADIETYLSNRFPENQFPAKLRQLIYRNTSGNPLFMTAVVDELLRQKSIQMQAGRWQVVDASERTSNWRSASVRELIEAQLSRLPVGEQRVLEAAAIVGTQFSSAEVAAALELEAIDVEERCEAVSRRGQFLRMVTDTSSHRPARHSRYEFLHDLHRTAAFDRSSQGRRRQWYRRIAEKVVADSGDQVDSVATELAYYFEHADMPLEAALYCAVAGERAWQRFAYSEAIGQFRRGIEFVRRLPASKERDTVELRLQVGLIQPLFQEGLSSEQVEAAISRALELNEKLGDGPQSFDTLRSFYTILIGRGDYSAALGICDKIDLIAQRESDPYFKTEALKIRGVNGFLTGRLLTSRDALMRAIENYRLQQGSKHYVEDDSSVSAGCYLAIVLWILGYPDQAQQRAREAFDRARSLHAPYPIALAHCYLAMLGRFLRDSATTLREADSAVVLCEKHGFVVWRAQASLERGWATIMKGQAAAGIKEIRSALASGTFGLSGSMTKMADVCLHLGRTREGLRAVTQALAYVEEHKETTWEPELHRLKGELLLQRAKSKGKKRDLEQAEVSLLAAIERSREIAAKSFELRAAMSLHKLWSRQNKGAQGKRMVAEVYDWFREGFATGDLVDARRLLGRR